MMKSSTLFEYGPLPPTSTSRPPNIIHVIGVPMQASIRWGKTEQAPHWFTRNCDLTDWLTIHNRMQLYIYIYIYYIIYT